MGVLHFAGLGRSAGAVTAGLSCIRDQYGAHHNQYGRMVEGVVIFTSPSVADGSAPAFSADHNKYMLRANSKPWAAKMDNALNIVVGYMEREFPDSAVYSVITDVNELGQCFEVVAQATLNFHAPGDVGKHIWANITGGSNLLNAALMQIAFLSGFIARLCYTFVADIQKDGKYLQAFSNDENEFRYGEMYPIKTRFGWRHQKVLEVLERLYENNPSDYVSSKKLLSRLKGEAPLDFQDMSIQTFRRDFLNVMQGVEQLGNRQSGQQDAVRLSEEGRNVLQLVRQPLYSALVRREQLPDTQIAEILAGFNIRRLR